MSLTADFCTQQADSARVAADAAELDNVRDNFERAEMVWRKLADQAGRVATERAARTAATQAWRDGED